MVAPAPDWRSEHWQVMGFLSAFFSGRIWVYLALVLGVFAAGATSAFKIQECRYSAKERDRVEQNLVAERLQAKETFQKSEHVISAQNAGTARLASLVRSVADAHSQLDSLRDTASMRLQASATSLDACTANANTLNVVFTQCAGRLQEVAVIADIWAIYAQTVNESVK